MCFCVYGSKQRIKRDVNLVARKPSVATNTNLPRAEKEKFKCVCCGEQYTSQDNNFYKTSSIIMKGNNNRMVVCKKCIIDLYEFLVKKYEDCKIALYFLCRLTDTYFDSALYPSVEQQAANSNSNIAKIYFQKINSLPQYTSKTFFDSTPIDTNRADRSAFEINDGTEWSDDDKRSKEDVIRMVGYDPFENENPQDKKYLYNALIDFLDESTLEDSFKLPIVIEIVKSFNQIDKINQALALITTDVSSIAGQVGGVKSLFDAKKNIYTSILAMAKDNGISVNHNNNRSKGGNTLNGIVKKLNEIGLSTAEVNLFDLETCEAMKQVADFSNKSILDQLMFDENDYTDMIAQQKDLIKKLDDELNKVKEDNRLLKIKMLQIEKTSIEDTGG